MPAIRPQTTFRKGPGVGQSWNHPKQNGRLLDLLIRLLQAAPASCWPGADGLTVEDALCCYRQAAASGRVPGLEPLLQAHPEWKPDLIAFFRKGEANS